MAFEVSKWKSTEDFTMGDKLIEALKGLRALLESEEFQQIDVDKIDSLNILLEKKAKRKWQSGNH